MLAGGAVCDVLRGREPGDLDLFAVGLTVEEAESLVRAFIELLAQQEAPMHKYSGTGTHVLSFAQYRTSNCITVRAKITREGRRYDAKDIEFQFITRLYATVPEVIHGFDIAPCAVAWDGRRVVYTELARFAHMTGVFPLELGKRRASYERRLKKYVMRKGFGLILPDLDLAAFAEGKEELAYLHTGYKRRQPHGGFEVTWNESGAAAAVWYDAKAVLEDKDVPLPGAKKPDADPCAEDDLYVYGRIPYLDQEGLMLFNARKLLESKTYLVCAPVVGGDWEVYLGPRLEETLLQLYHSRAHEGKLLGLERLRVFTLPEDFMGVAEALLRKALGRELPDDERKLAAAAKRVAAEVRARAKAVTTTFGWKASTQGTLLAPRKGGAAGAEEAEPLFPMSAVDPGVWYGAGLYAPPVLMKSALKC